MTGFINVADSAERLEVSRQTIYTWMRDGTLKGCQLILGHWAVPEVEVERLAKERQQQPEPQAA